MLEKLKALFTRKPARQLKGVQIAPWAEPESILSPLAGKASLIRYQFRIPDAETLEPDEYINAAAHREMPHLVTTLAVAAAKGMKVAICVMTPPKTGSDFIPTLCRLWTLIAGQVIDYGLQGAVYGYDLLNEPAMTGEKWNTLVKELRKAVRKRDKRTPVIVSCTFGDPANLRRLQPLKDRHVIYTFHHYYPMPFTHQGLYEFPMGRKGPTLDRLRNHLQAVRAWQQKNKARIYVGEFSCVRWAPEADCLSYLRESIRLFDSYGWDWTYHAWREWQGWSLEHDGPRDFPLQVETSPRKKLIFKALVSGVQG